MIETLHVCMHVSRWSCMDGLLHMSKGVQACRPACTHACMCKHMQVHTAWYAKAVISACSTMIDHDDQKVFMYACIAACVRTCTVALHINRGVQACRQAHTQVCTCERMQTRTAWCWGGYNRSWSNRDLVDHKKQVTVITVGYNRWVTDTGPRAVITAHFHIKLAAGYNRWV